MKLLFENYLKAYSNLTLAFNDGLNGKTSRYYYNFYDFKSELEKLGVEMEDISKCVDLFNLILSIYQQKSNKDFKAAKKALNEIDNILKEKARLSNILETYREKLNKK